MNKLLFIIFFIFLYGCSNSTYTHYSKNTRSKAKEVRYNIVSIQPKIPKSIHKKVLNFLYKILEEDKIKLGTKNPNLIKDYNSISSFYQYIEKDYNKALEYLKKSSKLSEEIFGQNHIETAKSYENIAFLYKRMKGNQDNALENFQKSLDINKKILGIEHPYTISNINSIGMIYYSKGDYQKALEYYQKIKNKDSLENMGFLYYAMGNYQKALKFYHKLLDTKDLTNLKKSKIYSDIGMIYYSYSDYKKALYFYKKSLIFYNKIRLDKKPLQKAEIYNNIGMVYYANKEYGNALDYFKRKALYINREYLNKIHPRVAQNYNWIGLTYLMLGKYDSSLKFLNDALTIRKNQLNKNHIDIADSYTSMALLYQKKGNYSKSLDLYKKSLDIFKSNKNRNYIILDNQQKLRYKQSSSKFMFNFLGATYLYKNKTTQERALNSWLNYKRAIFDRENSLKILYDKTSDMNIRENIDKLFNYQRKLAKLYQNIPTNDKSLKQYQRDIKKIEENISQIEILLSAKSLNLDTKDITYKQISKYLKPKELYIDFAKVKDSYYCFTLDKKENITFKRIDKEKTKKIELAIKAIQQDNDESLRDLKVAQEEYGKLYKLIIEPLSVEIKGKNSLIISPDGLLNLIPFEAFYNSDEIKEKRYLIQNFSISYIPSGKEFVKLAEDDSISNQNVVIFANSDFKSIRKSKKRGGIFDGLNEFNNLTYAVDEANSVKKSFINPQYFLDENATEENFMKVSKPKIWHIITHGFLSKNKKSLNPLLNCGIVLYGANESIRNKKGDGIITGLELAGMNLKGTELVVLSACLTGVGEVDNSEGVASISKAFRKAGAKYLLTTLWSIDDELTVTLMEHFYKYIDGGNISYGKALQKAKIDLIMDESNYHPYYWAGFVGSGRDR